VSRSALAMLPRWGFAARRRSCAPRARASDNGRMPTAVIIVADRSGVRLTRCVEALADRIPSIRWSSSATVKAETISKGEGSRSRRGHRGKEPWLRGRLQPRRAPRGRRSARLPQSRHGDRRRSRVWILARTLGDDPSASRCRVSACSAGPSS
jgi:hypothetical protein